VSRATRRLWVTATLVTLATGEAHAACPAYAGDSVSWLERFVASRPAGAAPPSEAEMYEWLRREHVPPIGVMPSRGPAPLPVRARWLFFPVADPVKIEYDVGDGRPQTFGSDYGRGQIPHTYDRPGHYDFTVWVHERGGGVQRYASSVEVLTPAAFESDIQSRWDTLKARLGRGDVASALDCIHSTRREEYARVFDEVFVKGRTRVDEVLTSITAVDVYPGVAVYQMLRTDARHGRLSYEVRFQIDGDGVWRLRSF
jgi:hypothetical protein